MSDINNKNIVGAWLLHHDQKLQSAQTTEFESIVVAGRSTRLLSVISQESQSTISMVRVMELARGLGIRQIEVGGYLDKLEHHGLIDIEKKNLTVLGVSQVTLLNHANDIFETQSPLGIERAVIDLAERGSHAPVRRKDCEEEIADEYSLSRQQIDDMFLQSEQIGFVDYENEGKQKLYFNGSLFKRDEAGKIMKVLESFSQNEKMLVLEAENLFKQRGCLLAEELRNLLGNTLWSKLHQIGLFEVSVVMNELGSTEFVSKPGALAKFIPNGLADMLDDAKALASSLTYGIVRSSVSRGKIREPSVLISTLINKGFVEGWASAIKQDYQVLESRGVVEVTSSQLGNRLTLLKPEIGHMAKDLILQGDASETAIKIQVGTHAKWFRGPEHSRVLERRKNIPETKSAVSRTLNVLRKA